MRALRLIGPSRDFESSYRNLVDEIRSRGEKPIPFPLGFPHDNFGELIAKLERNSQGQGLPAGFVANSTYWLVAQSEIVGVSNLRHSLTPRLRKEGGNIGYGVRPSARGRGLGTELLKANAGKGEGNRLVEGAPHLWQGQHPFGESDSCEPRCIRIRGISRGKKRSHSKVLD